MNEWPGEGVVDSVSLVAWQTMAMACNEKRSANFITNHRVRTERTGARANAGKPT